VLPGESPAGRRADASPSNRIHGHVPGLLREPPWRLLIPTASVVLPGLAGPVASSRLENAVTLWERSLSVSGRTFSDGRSSPFVACPRVLVRSTPRPLSRPTRCSHAGPRLHPSEPWRARPLLGCRWHPPKPSWMLFACTQHREFRRTKTAKLGATCSGAQWPTAPGSGCGTYRRRTSNRSSLATRGSTSKGIGRVHASRGAGRAQGSLRSAGPLWCAPGGATRTVQAVTPWFAELVSVSTPEPRPSMARTTMAPHGYNGGVQIF